jgi:hypothetical protein
MKKAAKKQLTPAEKAKRAERQAKIAARRKEFDEAFARVQQIGLWSKFQEVRAAVSEMPLEKRKETAQVLATILRRTARPGKRERIMKRLAALEAKKVALKKSLETT